MLQTFLYHANIYFKKIFYSTGIYLVAAIAVSVVILFGKFGFSYLRLIGGDESVSQEAFNESSNYITSLVGGGAVSPGQILTFIVFGLLGLMIYSIYFIINNAKVLAENERIANNYHLQHGTDEQAIQKRVKTKVKWAIGYFLFVILSVTLLFSLWLGLIAAYMSAGLGGSMLLSGILGYLGLVINVYLVIVLGLFLWRYEEKV